MPAAKELRCTAPQPQFMDASSDSPVSCTPIAATNSSLVLTTQVTIAVHRTPIDCPLRLLIPKERSSGSHAVLATFAIQKATLPVPKTSEKQANSCTFTSTVAVTTLQKFRLTAQRELYCSRYPISSTSEREVVVWWIF
jgi:hypothetical protein